MKPEAIILCVFLVAVLSSTLALARRKSSRNGGNKGSRGRKSKPVCELYKGGKLCEPYLKGQKVYVNRARATQVDTDKRVSINYGLLSDYVKPRCKEYLLPVLCNYAFPPCDLSSSEPKPRQFCQDDCYALKTDVCSYEFEQARRYPTVFRTLSDCSSMPAVGDDDYEGCIRVVNEASSGPTFQVHLSNITMFETKPVIFKCRLSTKKLPVNITWFKDGKSITSEHPTYKITAYHWGSRLRIRRARDWDAGKFDCIVKGPGGIVSASAWLKINPINESKPQKVHTVPAIKTEDEVNTSCVETLAPIRGVCEPYQGLACAEFIGNKTIWITKGQQASIERELSSALTLIKAANPISPRCTKYGIPGMCYHIFKSCDPATQEAKPRLCREDCFALYKDVCITELHLAQMDPHFNSLLPNCSELPTRDQKDHTYCISLGIPGVSAEPPVIVFEAPEEPCYNGTYNGHVNVSKSGRPCVPWPRIDPPHNYCRNLGDQRRGPWCYVGANCEKEYCDIKRCSQIAPRQARDVVRSVGRTVYVIAAIMAVLIVAFLSIIVYLKVQHRKCALPQRNHASSASISKSTQSTLQPPSFDLKQSISELKSCVFNENQEISHGKVKFLESVGEGGFAKVCKGALMRTDSEHCDVQIAIKKLKQDVPAAAVENFKKETSILANLQDVNVLCLIGVSAGEEPRFMVFEYYTDIDMHRFLVENASRLAGLIPSDSPESILLLDFSLQVASGMDFLAENNFVHRDLAARSCYVTEDNIVKISNLGIGSHKYPSDYSWVHGSALLPVRWMSPEALNMLQFSHEADVWSYGVLLWELYSYGSQPYVGLTNQEAIEKIRNLQLLPCPDNCPARMFQLMRECWEENPTERPQFTEICSRVREWAGDSIADSH